MAHTESVVAINPSIEVGPREPMQVGTPEFYQALATLERGREAFPARLSVRRMLGKAYLACGQVDDAEAELRAAAALPDADAETIRQLATILRRQGKPDEGLRALATAGKCAAARSNILLACMPKSGSSWLRTMLTGFEGLEGEHMGPPNSSRSAGREQELDFSYLQRPREHWFVAQHHVRATVSTEQAVDTCKILPVVLVRNFLDNLVSAKDHFNNPNWPLTSSQFTIDERFRDWDETRLLEFLVDYYAPWLVNFVVSWRFSRLDSVWISYETLVADPEAVLSVVLAQAGVEAPQNSVQEGVERIRREDGSRTLLNVGRTGRGAQLPDAIQDRVRSLCRYYPDIPFNAIGLL